MTITTPQDNASNLESGRNTSADDAVDQVASTSGESGTEEKERSVEDIRERIAESARLKADGTEAFKAKQWAQARATYSMALAKLPKRVKDPSLPPFDRTKIPNPGDKVNDIEDEEAGSSGSENGERGDMIAKGKERGDNTPILSEMQMECAKARAVLNANIGACYVNQEKYAEAVKSCTEAIEDDPTYVKAIQRRAACNEKIGTWSSLSSAQEDYNTLLKLLPPDSPQIGPAKRTLQALKPRIEAKQKEETAEMLSKLKGLGNSILGNFGLSTDNFKFEQNEQGGYSMNFVR